MRLIFPKLQLNSRAKYVLTYHLYLNKPLGIKFLFYLFDIDESWNVLKTTYNFIIWHVVFLIRRKEEEEENSFRIKHKYTALIQHVMKP